MKSLIPIAVVLLLAASDLDGAFRWRYPRSMKPKQRIRHNIPRQPGVGGRPKIQRRPGVGGRPKIQRRPGVGGRPKIQRRPGFNDVNEWQSNIGEKSGSSALKCYTCLAEGSESCVSGSRTCSIEKDRCLKIVYKSNQDSKFAVKAQCTTKTECNQMNTTCAYDRANYPWMDSCVAYCCSTDNCNASPKSASATFAVFSISFFAAILME